jgi:Protein of unknown function (DUF664)
LADAERGWVRRTFRGEQIPDLYYRADAPAADIEEADPVHAEEDFERYRAECRAVGCCSTWWRSTPAIDGSAGL